jgi:hypothetical protein
MFIRLLPKLCLAAVLTGSLIANTSSPAVSIQGVLIDEQCSHKAETHVVEGTRLEGGIVVAYTHTRKCALMPECRKSGYGVFGYEDRKFHPFDEAGNRKALEFFQNSKQEEDFRVEVSGSMQGDVFKVERITPWK